MIGLFRYDTEFREEARLPEIAGFLETAVEVHRREAIPATFFCTGSALDVREPMFRDFWADVKDDPLFDVQDHSYTHIGLCYEAGPTLEALRADYERSFAAHERVLGVRPIGVSICGTSGRDGASLDGFGATEKSRAEFELMASLGVKFINTKLAGKKGSAEFCHYGPLGHPEIMGFPSAYSDTGWLVGKSPDEGVAFMTERIAEHAANGWHLPVLCHDWAAWLFGEGKTLGHIVRIADAARGAGFELLSHLQAYERRELWEK